MNADPAKGMNPFAIKLLAESFVMVRKKGHEAGIKFPPLVVVYAKVKDVDIAITVQAVESTEGIPLWLRYKELAKAWETAAYDLRAQRNPGNKDPESLESACKMSEALRKVTA